MSKRFFILFLISIIAFSLSAIQLTTYDPNPNSKTLQSEKQTAPVEKKAVLFMVDFSVPAASVINPLPFEPVIWVSNASAETMADYWIRVSIKDALTNELKYRDSLLVTDSLYSAADTEWVMPSFSPEYLMQ